MATSQDFVNWVCGEALVPDFLMYLMLAQGDYIKRFASGSVHQTIYFPEVKAFHICHPTVAVQRQICEMMAAVAEQAEKLIAKYEQQLHDLHELRQGLLKKAFAGQLTGGHGLSEAGGVKSEPERIDFDAMYDEILDEAFKDGPPTAEETAESRRRDPKMAEIVDKLSEIFPPKKR